MKVRKGSDDIVERLILFVNKHCYEFCFVLAETAKISSTDMQIGTVTPCSTSGRILTHYRPFRSFWYVLVNTGRNWRFDQYEFWTFFSLNLMVELKHSFSRTFFFFFDPLWLSSSQFKTSKKKKTQNNIVAARKNEK